MVLMFGTTFIDWLMSLVIAHNSWQVWRVWNQPVKIGRPGASEDARPSDGNHDHRSSAISLSWVFSSTFNFGIDSYNSLVQSVGLEARN